MAVTPTGAGPAPGPAEGQPQAIAINTDQKEKLKVTITADPGLWAVFGPGFTFRGLPGQENAEDSHRLAGYYFHGCLEITYLQVFGREDARGGQGNREGEEREREEGAGIGGGIGGRSGGRTEEAGGTGEKRETGEGERGCRKGTGTANKCRVHQEGARLWKRTGSPAGRLFQPWIAFGKKPWNDNRVKGESFQS